MWFELIDLPSFLWGGIKKIASSLGKVLFSSFINSPNRNRVCVLWKVDAKTLEINIRVGKIVKYLKWGFLSGACYHFGNPRHFTKNYPTVSKSKIPMIPSYLVSKIKVPSKQVFGRNRTTIPFSDRSPSNSQNRDNSKGTHSSPMVLYLELNSLQIQGYKAARSNHHNTKTGTSIKRVDTLSFSVGLEFFLGWAYFWEGIINLLMHSMVIHLSEPP